MSAISRADADDMTPSSRVFSVADAADALATAMVAVTEMDAATISRVTALASTPAALAITAWMPMRSVSPYSLTDPERLNDTVTAGSGGESGGGAGGSAGDSGSIGHGGGGGNDGRRGGNHGDVGDDGGSPTSMAQSQPPQLHPYSLSSSAQGWPLLSQYSHV